MDTRRVSPAVRRRVGSPASLYSQADNEGVISSVPIETDWRIVEAAFEAKRFPVVHDFVPGV